jgi:hypothetical protein
MTRAIPAACLLAALAVPASAQIVRVSVSTAGVEANGPSGPPSISANGRFVVFSSSATNLVSGDTNGVADVFLRDRDTDADGILDEPGAVATTRVSVASGGTQLDAGSGQPVISADGRYVVFASAATNLMAGSNGVAQIYRVDRTTGDVVRVSQSAAGAAGDQPSSQPAVSANGDVIAFVSGAGTLDDQTDGGLAIFVREVTAAKTTRITPLTPVIPIDFYDPSISSDGNRVAYLGLRVHPLVTYAAVFDRAAGSTKTLNVSSSLLALSASGRDVVTRDPAGVLRRTVVDTGAATSGSNAPSGTPAIVPPVSPSARYVLTEGARLNDFDLGGGVATSLGFVPGGGAFSADDRWLAVVSGTNTLVGGDVNGVDDVFVIDLPDFLDADNDTMDDRWETLFGVTDPNADPDADGQTNAQEFAAGTHPNGTVRRFLAEGATGSFFHTTLALANPSPTLAATAVLTFDRGDGTRVRRSLSVPAGRSATVDVGAVTGLEFSDVSTTVESDRLLAVERSMTWGSPIYGSHAETATPSPSATWFLAEGSTVLGFDLFYLLQNPQATTTHATVRFLQPDGTVVTRTYDLAPGSRTTVYVNQIPGLDETDVSGDISADAPIVVERAMYRSTATQTFALGTESMGVPTPATSWFLAEGATGAFFDLYVLIANPGNADATVQATFLRPDGSTVARTYTVRAHSRFSVYVDGIPGLEATSVATTLTANVPIVAERAMYWPNGFFEYYEGHSSAGATATAQAWTVAGGENGGTDSAQTFVLIANTSNTAGEATVTVLPGRDFTGTAPTPAVIPLPPNSRTTVPMTSINGTFGVLVQSTGGSPVPLVVESAVYRTPAGSPIWSAGSNALATPVP